jgi:hypothetical protein
MGLGTSMSLFDQLIRLPVLFPPAYSASAVALSPESPSGIRELMSRPLALPVLAIDLDHLMPPEVQRQLLDFFLETISLEIPPVLSKQHESLFLQEINPLAMSSTAPNTWLRVILLSIYSISARVLSRDFNTDYAHLENICLNEVSKALPISLGDFFAYDQNALDQVTILCLCIIYELVGPSRSKISLDVLNAGQTLLAIVPYITKNDGIGHQSASRLAFFLSQAEALVTLIMVKTHFRNG